MGLDAGRAFQPSPSKSTVRVDATTTTSRTALPAFAGGQVRVTGGLGDCRLTFGDSTVTAATPAVGNPGSMLIKAGSVEVFTVPPGTTHVAVKTDTATASIELTPGFGL
ncbi:hypothetical protein [Methylobacterium marchantiae]|uniref:Uncharacterized protein n=1 Tax=Methylobacterium marchantiae TaxID=600331 RepID=A0ABW3X2S5_9HYPH|nr:hypothetical protein AIGOOFII_3459 [Methylobacterium marchantiae]